MEGLREIPLSMGYVAMVDAADAAALSPWTWGVSGNAIDGFYAAGRRKDGPQIAMHRVIMAPPAGVQVDHINGDTLDNRRANLRLCTPSQNNCNRGVQSNNTSGYKGVSRAKNGAWKVGIAYGGHRHHLGYFRNISEAARAYDAAALTYHGQFARLNFPAAVSA